MTPLADLVPPALLRALGLTLLHSLWQGALVGLLTAALLTLLHRHAAVVRYRVAAGGLAALLLLAGLTFAHYCPPAAQVGATDLARPASVIGGATGVAGLAILPATTGLPRWLAVGSGYVEQHLPLLVGGWLLGMTAMLLRLLGGLAYVQRLRHYRVAALPAGWQNWLDGLARRAGLRQRVHLLASALVTSPVVVGWLRPVVLLPLGLATGLPTPALEMLLAHELAHVLRRDYLFNLLQSVAEIVFFYHPAVWFLAASLRAERENCCDDLATQLHGDSRLLAEALSAVAELHYAASRPRLVLAAAGPTGSLLERVRRLVQQAPAAPTFAEGFGAAVVVLVGLALLTGSTLVSLGAAPGRVATRVAASGRVASFPALRSRAAASSDTTRQEAPAARTASPASAAAARRRTLPQQPPLAKLDPLTAAKMPRLAKLGPLTVENSAARAQQAAAEAELRRQEAHRKLIEAHQKIEQADLLRQQAGYGTQPHQREARRNLVAAHQKMVRADLLRQQADANAARHQQEAQSKLVAAQQQLAQADLLRRQADRNLEAAHRAAAATPRIAPLSPAQSVVFMQGLHREGVLAPTVTSADLLFEGPALTVNGQPQPAAVAARYRSRLHIPADAAGRVTGRVHVILNE